MMFMVRATDSYNFHFQTFFRPLSVCQAPKLGLILVIIFSYTCPPVMVSQSPGPLAPPSFVTCSHPFCPCHPCLAPHTSLLNFDKGCLTGLLPPFIFSHENPSVLVIYFCITNFLKMYWLKTANNYHPLHFLKVGIWKELSWLVLAQGLLLELLS